MAWEEWEQLKAQAADRHSTRMQLNQYPADRGGGGSTAGDLVAEHKDLEAVGKAAHDLFDDFTTYSGHARAASEAASGGLKGAGFALGGALEHVTQRWSEQTRTLVEAQEMHSAKDQGLYMSAKDLYAMRDSVNQQTQWSTEDALARHHVKLPEDDANDVVRNAVNAGWDASSEYLSHTKERP
ncbi:hypothetical protein [Streptomyces sp. NPDC002386]